MTRRNPRPASAFDRAMYGETMPHAGCPHRHVTHPPHPLFLGTEEVAYCEGLPDPMAQFPMGDLTPGEPVFEVGDRVRITDVDGSLIVDGMVVEPTRPGSVRIAMVVEGEVVNTRKGIET